MTEVPRGPQQNEGEFNFNIKNQTDLIQTEHYNCIYYTAVVLYYIRCIHLFLINRQVCVHHAVITKPKPQSTRVNTNLFFLVQQFLIHVSLILNLNN